MGYGLRLARYAFRAIESLYPRMDVLYKKLEKNNTDALPFKRVPSYENTT